jgi:hypothetical protein
MSGIRKSASGKGWEAHQDDRDRVVVYDNGFAFAFDTQESVSTFSFEENNSAEPTEADITLDELVALVREKGRPLDEKIVYGDPGSRFPILSSMSTFSFIHADLKIHYSDLGMAFAIRTEDPIVLELTLSELIELCHERENSAQG